jgi:hypothetical protein
MAKGLIVPLESLVDHYKGFVIATKQVDDGLWLAFGQTAGEERPDGLEKAKLTGQGATKREAIKDLQDNIDTFRKSVKERRIILGN